MDTTLFIGWKNGIWTPTFFVLFIVSYFIIVEEVHAWARVACLSHWLFFFRLCPMSNPSSISPKIMVLELQDISFKVLFCQQLRKNWQKKKKKKHYGKRYRIKRFIVISNMDWHFSLRFSYFPKFNGLAAVGWTTLKTSEQHLIFWWFYLVCPCWSLSRKMQMSH
jgi:hypothetical protein